MTGSGTADSWASGDVARRTVLVAACAGCATIVAGCGGGSGSTASGGAAPTGSTASTGSAPPSTAGTSSSPGGGAGLVALADVPVGGSVDVKGPQGALLVSQPTKGKVVAFSARCTHMGCTVKADGAKLSCPCHGSVYSAATGQVEGGPAPAPLAPFPVKVVGGQVVPV